MALTTSEVGGVVNGLRSEGLATARMDGRADRYEQHLSRKLALSTRERAVICVLMLRSSLTLNEIRINTGRMVSFDTVEELQELIDQLSSVMNHCYCASLVQPVSGKIVLPICCVVNLILNMQPKL